jgi:SAM-dependent methyltransferase
VVGARPAGRVYTPAALADRVAGRTLGPLLGTSPDGLRICDPACGDGALLAAAWKAAGGSGAVGRLAGADTDPAAIAAARARLRLAGAEPDLMCGDALRLDWEPGGFDAIVANPPWVSWSGRHAQDLPEAARRAYAARYAAFRGWRSLHGLFVELALDLCRPGGRIGLLLPAQVCDLEGYGPLRAVVRERARVLEAWDLGEAAFEGVTQPCCALFLEAGAAGAASPEPFPLARPGAAARVEALARCPKPPAAKFSDMGVHTGNCAGKLLRDRGLPLREGRDVGAYVLRPPRRWLAAGAQRGPGEYFRMLPEERYLAVPILLRQTAARPVAALHADPAAFRNSVLACLGLPGVAPERIVAWLNSSAVAAWHRARVREASQRAFPQLKIAHLRDLPAPPWGAPPRGLAAAARAVAAEGRLDLEPDLDALVSRWLGLPAGMHDRLRE